MAVLKQTSPMAEPGAPKPVPSKKVPAASIKPPLLKGARENAPAAVAALGLVALLMEGSFDLRENRDAYPSRQPQRIQHFQWVGIIHRFRIGSRAFSDERIPCPCAPS